MLPRKNRLPRRHLEATLRRGRRLETPYVRIYIKQPDSEQRLRLAIVVGKRVAKSAVRRHRLTRLLRSAALTCFQNQLGSCDMVVVAKPAAAGVQTQQVFLEDLKTIRI